MDDMPWMHEQISVGLQNVLFGPVVWLDKLGMQQANDSKRRKKYKTSEQSELHGLSVSLGKKHTSYHIVPKTAVWKELLVLAALLACPWHVPRLLSGFPSLKDQRHSAAMGTVHR